LVYTKYDLLLDILVMIAIIWITFGWWYNENDI